MNRFIRRMSQKISQPESLLHMSSDSTTLRYHHRDYGLRVEGDNDVPVDCLGIP